MLGTVRFYDITKAWGFIAGDDGQDYFVHRTGLALVGQDRLDEKQRVTFDVIEGRKGPQAAHVKSFVEK